MSAVPKKKLCWNCDGNISNNLDNCPYCGVYLQGTETKDNHSLWNPSYKPTESSEQTLNIASPLYSSQEEEDSEKEEENTVPLQGKNSVSDNQRTIKIVTQLKKDVLPILFLMGGSLFFLFGIVLLLFSHNGALTLQWKAHYWIYFIISSAVMLFLGWRFLSLQEQDSQD